jgi:hypothetical protein
MTSQGSAHATFRRAIDRGNLLVATAVARELRTLSLADSFALLLLFADKDATKFERAAPRWHARLVDAAGDLTITDAQAALGALALLPTPARPEALELLRALCRDHGIRL